MVEQVVKYLPEARPPTPPRTSGRVLPGFNKQKRSKQFIDSESSSGSPSLTRRKKVNFSEYFQYSDPPSPSSDSSGDIKGPLRLLPPSAERKVQRSSILKVSKEVPEKLLGPHGYANFGNMLQSILNQLGGIDRISKIDAYLQLSGALKVTDSFPNTLSLKENIGPLCQFIKRDLTAVKDDGTSDSGLIIHALTLLASLMYKKQIFECFAPDFMIFLVENSIWIFEKCSMSKDVTRTWMFVLAKHNFPPKIMTSERVGRLVTALHHVDQKIKGKSIVIGRIEVYRALLRSARPHMSRHTIWINDLFSDMLSSLNEIQNLAILFGLESSVQLRTEGFMYSAFSALLDSELEDKGRYVDVYIDRLEKMIANGQSAKVPRIWSVAMLFLQYKPENFYRWKFMNTFLEVLGHCMNRRDIQTNKESYYAWSRLIFTVQPSEKTPKNIRDMLFKPLGMLLTSRKDHSCALGCVNTLLYYAFRPGCTTAQLDIYWDEYLKVIILQGLVVKNAKFNDVRKNIEEAVLLLVSLFDKKTKKWSQTRAVDNLVRNDVLASELPILDPKWLRRNSSRVFSVLHPLLAKLYWDLGHDSPMLKLWEKYIESIASPAVMEVRVSMETMGCIARIFEFLYRTWGAGVANVTALPSLEVSQGSHAFLKSFQFIISKTITGLGVLAFTDRQLSIANDAFIPIATPCHQTKNIQTQSKIALHHLLILFTKPCPGLDYNTGFVEMLGCLLGSFFDSRTTRKSKLDLATSLLELILLEEKAIKPLQIIWQVIASFSATAVDMTDKKETMSDLPLAAEYQRMIRILEIGIKISPQPLPGWNCLLESVLKSAALDAGDAGRAIAVIEPLSEILCQIPGGAQYVQVIIPKVRYPQDCQAMEYENTKLWGAKSKPSSLDLFVHLYEYLCASLLFSYDTYIPPPNDILKLTTSLLARCPSQMLLSAITRLQHGIAAWILDADSKLSPESQEPDITMLCSAINLAFPNMLRNHSPTKVLRDLEKLLCSGLETKHMSIAKASVIAWNSNFGGFVEELDYPDRLKEALLCLEPVLEVKIPSFFKSVTAEAFIGEAQLVSFLDSQAGDGEYPSNSKSDIKSGCKTALSRSQSSTPSVVTEIGHSRKRFCEGRSGWERAIEKNDLTPKAHHEDSHIQFHAIKSSPVERSIDSQLLTKKPNEMRFRQHNEAAIFTDIGFNSQKRHSNDLGLPSHRSSSMRDQSRNVRPATPPVNASDDDHFITSSPTPVRSFRSVRGSADDVDLPSAIEIMTEIIDIPSSPPETNASVDIDTTSQIGEDIADSFHKSPRTSASEIDTGSGCMSPISNSSSYLKTGHITLDPMITGLPTLPTITRYPSLEISESENSENTPSDQLLHEASPMKNDVHATGKLSIPYGSQFEDKILSPAQKLIAPTQEHTVSFSSATREETQQIIEPVDQAVRTSTRACLKTVEVTSKKRRVRGVRSSLASNNLPQDAMSSPGLVIDMCPKSGTVNSRKSSPPFSDIDDSSLLRIVARYDFVPTKRKDQILAKEKTNTTSISISQPLTKNESGKKLRRQSKKHASDRQSPISFAVPETPAPGTPLVKFPSEPVFDHEGELLQEDSTIMVNVPHLDDPWPSFKRVALDRRRGSKKRNRDEVPDSQDADIGIQDKTNLDRVKRPRISSQHEEIRAGAISVGHFALVADTRNYNLDGCFIQSQNASPDKRSEKVYNESEIPQTLESEEMIVDTQDASPELSKDDKDAETDKFDQTTVDDSLPLEGAILAPSATDSQAPVSEAPIDRPRSTIEVIKNTIRSLISGFRNAAFNNQEVHEIEDMFMDAKRALYNAGYRGRQAGTL